MWTSFHDMYSGGSQKEKYKIIYIEAVPEEAKIIFYNRFGHNPDRVTCTCCGKDYSIDSHQLLEQLTGYERNLLCLETPFINGRYNKPDDPYFYEHYYLEPGEVPKEPYKIAATSWFCGKELTMEEYKTKEDILIIYKEEIKPEERKGTVPTQGYVWVSDDE